MMFVNLKAKNFLSWADLEFTFDSGVTLLEGFNHDEGMSEGSGKSSIPNALCWTLYGKLPKDARADEVIKEGEKGCETEVQLTNGSKVCRSRHPNDVWIEEPNGDVVKGKDARETQELIDDLIGMSFETFAQSVYFAQGYPNRFVTANEEQKSKILSEILNVKVFDDARKLVAEELKGVALQHANLQRDLKSLEVLADLHSRSVDSFQEEVDRFEDEKAEKISQIEHSVANLESDLSERKHDRETFQLGLQDQEEFFKWEAETNDSLNQESERLSVELGSYDGAVRSRKQLQSQVDALARDYDRALAALERANNHVATCPSCKRPLDEDLDARQAILSELRSKVDTLGTQHYQATQELQLIEVPDVTELRKSQTIVAAQRLDVQKARREFKAQSDVLSKKVLLERDAESLLKKALKELSAAKSTSNTSMQNKLVEAQKTLNEVQVGWEELNSKVSEWAGKQQDLEALKQAFREVKSYVFREVLAELSRKTNSYLQELFQIPVSARFNNVGEEGEISKILVEVTMNGIERPLGLYSGGQFRRLQLAIDLALSDIVSARGSKPLGLRIFDESCKDLSAQSMETVVRLLERLKGSTIVIEHNELIKSAVSRVFKVELKDGTSYASQDNHMV